MMRHEMREVVPSTFGSPRGAAEETIKERA